MKLWIRNILQNIINRIESEEDKTLPEDYFKDIESQERLFFHDRFRKNNRRKRLQSFIIKRHKQNRDETLLSSLCRPTWFHP